MTKQHPRHNVTKAEHQEVPLKRQGFVRFSAAVCVAPWAALARAQADRLRIGLTAVILADQAAFLARWSAYLSQRLNTRVSFVTRDEYQPLHEMLGSGQIDALWTCGYPYVRFQSQLRLLAVPLYRGEPTYQSYLIRPAGDASVSGWSDLRDKVFAYSDPLSNSGWLVAQGQLASAGIGPRALKRTFFAHGHRNVAEAVAARLANAGSIDGYVWETMKLQGMSAVAQTEVIWKSPLHGFPPLVAPIGVAHLGIDELQRTLLAMHRDDAGRALLADLNLDGFVAGVPGMFDSIRTLARSVPGSGVAAV
jgi:phosphonate transport system substrate-binding protein